jgi:hypothetical protein
MMHYNVSLRKHAVEEPTVESSIKIILATTLRCMALVFQPIYGYTVPQAPVYISQPERICLTA